MKRKRIRPRRSMQWRMKFMFVKNKSKVVDKMTTISMPRVLLHLLEKSVVIPDDVIREILVKLAMRSVGKFRCICKSWLSITTDLSFIRSHTQHNRFTQSPIIKELRLSNVECYLASVNSNTDVDFTLYKLGNMKCLRKIASCDGLIYVHGFCSAYIINPLTGYFINAPLSEGTYLGFYFHNSTSKYRVLYDKSNIMANTIVLVVGEQTWRHIPCHVPCRTPFSYFHNALDLNECLFWLAFTNGYYGKQPNTILKFDKEFEVYDLLSLPPLEKLHNLVGNLVDFKGALGLWVIDNNNIDVWIMEEYWVKKYSINYFDLNGHSACLGSLNVSWIEGVAIFINDNECLIDQNVSLTQRYFIRCNLKSGACCYRQKRINAEKIDRSFPYIETLVYPDCF